MTRNVLLRGSAMTPAERARGRFMRAPDHTAADTAAAPDPAATTTADAAKATDDAANATDAAADATTDTTALGSASGDAPPADATDADKAGDGQDKGGEKPPVGAPEKYELQPPEGMTIDADALALAEPVFREMNLDNDQAQKLTNAYAQIVPKIAERIQGEQATLITEQRAAWAAEAKADPEIGGKHWAASIAASAKALDALGAPAGSPFRQLLDDSGLGNHPEMIRMFTNIGKRVGEDPDFISASNRVADKRDAADILYPNDTPKGA